VVVSRLTTFTASLPCDPPKVPYLHFREHTIVIVQMLTTQGFGARWSTAIWMPYSIRVPNSNRNSPNLVVIAIRRAHPHRIWCLRQYALRLLHLMVLQQTARKVVMLIVEERRHGRYRLPAREAMSVSSATIHPPRQESCFMDPLMRWLIRALGYSEQREELY
jgi:hypothetical protein